MKCYEMALTHLIGMPVAIHIFHTIRGKRNAWVYYGKEMKEVNAECSDLELISRIARALEKSLSSEQ